MSVFKFLSFASLSLLFLGNIKADCIDLTGSYACENGSKLTLSLNTDSQGTVTEYTITNEVEGETKTDTISIPYSLGLLMKVTCNENQLIFESSIASIKSTIVLDSDGNLIINSKAKGRYVYDKKRRKFTWKYGSQTPVRTFDEIERCIRM